MKHLTCMDCFEKRITRGTISGPNAAKRCKICAIWAANTPEWRAKISASLVGRCGKEARNYKGVDCYSKSYKLRKQREWCKKNPERLKRMQQARLSRKKNGGPLTTQTVQLVYEDNIKKYGTLTCIYCLIPIEFGKDSLEHKIALANGGTNEYNNLGIACISCNCSKKHSKKFRGKRGTK